MLTGYMLQGRVHLVKWRFCAWVVNRDIYLDLDLVCSLAESFNIKGFLKPSAVEFAIFL